jgi:hypothetical protein
MELPPNTIPFFDHRLGRVQCLAVLTGRHLATAAAGGFAANNEDDGVTRASVEDALRDIVVPRDANATSPEFDKAIEEVDAIQAFFFGSMSGMRTGNPAPAHAQEPLL